MVAFEETFWGEKYAGFDVLLTNFKQGSNASKELGDFIKERNNLEDVYYKTLLKLANKCSSANGHIGSFEPCWKFLQSSTEKLANVHCVVGTHLADVGKAIKEYSDQQKEKQKQLKDEFNTTSEVVQNIQQLSASVLKAKEGYILRCAEVDKSRKESKTLSIKDIEKNEAKLKKACEDYKLLLEKREGTRNEYETKMIEASKKFQALEAEHLGQMRDFMNKYLECLTTERYLLDQVIDEFNRNMKVLSIETLLHQFVFAKQTGMDVPASLEFEEVKLKEPPVDIEALVASRQEEKRKTKKERKEKKTRKKEKAPKVTENGSVNRPDGTPEEQIEVDEEGYRIRPPDTDSIKSGKSRDSFSSDSGSDTDDDEPRKIQVKIKPKEQTASPALSVDELRAVGAQLTLNSPSTVKRLGDEKRLGLGATKAISRSNDALLDIGLNLNESNSDTASIKSLPLSASFDSLQPSGMLDTLTKTKSNNDIQIPNLLDTEGAFGSTTSSPNQDWASEFPTASNPPKATSEILSDAPESPPPLPMKRRSYKNKDEVTKEDGKPQSPEPTPVVKNNNNNSIIVNKSPASSPTEFMGPPTLTSSRSSTSLPRPKPVGQLPTLAPPSNPRRNTTSGRAALPRPYSFGTKPPIQPAPQPAVTQPAVTQPAFSQSSFADLVDIFSAPPLTNSTAASTNSQTSSTASSPTTEAVSPEVPFVASFPALPSQTTGSASSPEGDSKSTPELLVRGDQQAPSTIHSLQPPPGNNIERATPIAVAFVETVNAFFKGSDQSKCMVKVTGDMTVSFPSAIISLLTLNPSPPILKFHVTGTTSLEQIFPNKALVEKEGQLVGGDAISFKFNMQALAAYLKKQSEQGSNASYYNIDILKYQVRSSGVQSTPLQLCPYWRCDTAITDLKLDYKYNPACMVSPVPLTALSVVVPVDGGVEIMHSKPSASWSGEHQRAVWKLPTLSANAENKGVGSLRARFDVSKGPSTPAPIGVQFSGEGSTISNLNFDLKTSAYKLSLVKKRFASGKYIADA